jgi:Ca-activated chloride channel family protein
MIRFEQRVTDRWCFGRTLLCSLVLVISFCTISIAQGGSPPNTPRQTQQRSTKSDEDEEVVRISSKLVVVPVSVTNAKGDPVLGLTMKDFIIEEEGRRQEIAQIGDPDQVPIELALLLDVSGSVKAKFDFEKEAAARFLREVLKQNDRATIFAIDEEPKRVQERTAAEEAAQKVLSIEPANKATAFYDTIAEAARYLERSTPARHRRVIVVISDGEDNHSEEYKSAAAALAEVQRADAVFYAINPSGQSIWLNKISTRGQEGMVQIAQATGGTTFLPNLLEDLEPAFRQIAAELRSQYLLQYYSSVEAPEGTFRRIAVRVAARPDLRVRARQGYYVTSH